MNLILEGSYACIHCPIMYADGRNWYYPEFTELPEANRSKDNFFTRRRNDRHAEGKVLTLRSLRRCVTLHSVWKTDCKGIPE